MKIINNAFFRALCAVVGGILLLYYPDYMRNGLVIAIGIVFLLSGAISCISYFVTRRRVAMVKQRIAENNEKFNEQIEADIEKPFFPIVGIGSIILGFILALSPETFVKWLAYVLGGVIIIGAIGELALLISARKYWKMHYAYWILPSLLLLTGLFVVIYPDITTELPFIILGIALIVYGISECITSFSVGKQRRRHQLSLEQLNAETNEVVTEEAVVEEVEEVTPTADATEPEPTSDENGNEEVK